MSSLTRELCAGAAAGAIATLPMTAVMEGVRRTLPRSEQDPIPPRQITERAAESAGIADDMTDRQKDAATAAAHLGFGAGAGALYGLLGRLLPGGPAAGGVGYGLAVWASSYLGWLPATGLYKHPRDEPAGRHAKTILSHAVWGACLGLLHRQFAGQTDRRSVGDRLSSPEAPAAAAGTGV
jgi:hypothetical protein